MSVVVYSQPSCTQCTATYRKLDAMGVPYTVVDMSQDREARDYVMSLGFQQAPVVMAGDQMWSGFRPDRIVKLAALVAA